MQLLAIRSAVCSRFFGEISVVVETFPRPFRDPSTCLNFEIVSYINIPTTKAMESNDLNTEN